MPSTDADLLAQWDDLCVRLAWLYGPDEGRRRYEALAEGDDPDLLAWRALDGLVAE